jgi:hypothetical protein
LRSHSQFLSGFSIELLKYLLRAIANGAIVIIARFPIYFWTSFLRAKCTTIFGTAHPIQESETRLPDEASPSQGSASHAGLPLGPVIESAEAHDAAAPQAEKSVEQP